MIRVDVEAGARAVDRAALEEAVRLALTTRGVARAELSLTLLGDRDMSALNREHLGHDGPTDVLSFALWEAGEPVVVGDVYVGYEQAHRQAEDEGVALGEELVRLAVHGTLHVTGMEHPEAAAARPGSEMYELQERLVRALVAGDSSAS